VICVHSNLVVSTTDGHAESAIGNSASQLSDHTQLPELERRGHRAVAVDIAENDPALGLWEYAQIVDRAVGGQPGVVLVAQSLGGFTAPMVSQPVAMIVLLNAMIPEPCETPGEWFETTGSDAAGRSSEFDIETHFLHDLPAEARAVLAAAGPPREPADTPPREPADTPFRQPCAFQRWPDVPIKVLIGADDRCFPAGFSKMPRRGTPPVSRYSSPVSGMSWSA
jgi:hypothetical protein